MTDSRNPRRPFLAQQASVRPTEAPPAGRYDDEQQVQLATDQSTQPFVASEEAVRRMVCSGRLRGGDGQDEDLHDGNPP